MNAKLLGSGEPVIVLAHGFGGTQSVWDEIVPGLSTRRIRILLFDWCFSSSVDNSLMPTYDFSKYSSLGDFADDLISLLDDMKVKDVVYVGHSMAGMIGVIASVRRPDLFKHLVLVGASPRYMNGEDYTGGFNQSAIEEMLSVIESNFPTWAENFATLAIRAEDPTAKPAQKFCAGFKKMRPETALSVAKIVFLSDFRDLLDEVEARCTVVQGSDDMVVPLSVSHYMVSKMKVNIADLEVIDSAGHFPQLTCPNVLVDIIDRAVGTKNW